jgi:hypothetical protein
MTQLAFEDYRAIQKIEKDLRMIGFTSYQVYSHNDRPPDIHRMNRAWLCLPRNRLGIKQLRTYERLRFGYPTVSKGQRRFVSWRCDNGATVNVSSPMWQYLQLQRKGMDTSKEWHPQLSQIVAKDFAVLSRLRDQSTRDGDDGPLYDYFFAGVRGLGTWGAAWFMDRRYCQFNKTDPNQNIEMLLEVVFRDGRILDARDVSSEPPSYFRDQNSSVRIRRTIRDYSS